MSCNRKCAQKRLMKSLAIIFLLILSGCVSQPKTPINFEDVCEIFKAKPRWYKAAKKSTEIRGGNLQLPMAIIYQESTFRHNARPARKKVLGFLPGKRPSNAYGYAQALEGTWGEYEVSVNSRRKRRDNFADAFDFVQWYVHNSYQRNGVSKWNYNAHYLNYHEGQGGYARGSYANKAWLINTAKRVDQRARRYGAQLQKCQATLDARKTGWF